MKNLNSFFIMTAEKEKDLIPLSEVAEKECGLLALSDGKGGLTHFYVRTKDGFRRFLSEMCRSWSVECDGRILQLSFNRHKALCYVNDDNEAVIIGASFVRVAYAGGADGVISIRVTEEIPDDRKAGGTFWGKSLFPARQRDVLFSGRGNYPLENKGAMTPLFFIFGRRQSGF